MPDRTRNIHERFLRHIWSRRYLDEPRLKTCDNRPLSVLDPGKLNLDSGPDFQDARIRIGGTTFVGDVEIHRTPSDWMLHQHQHDPRYNKVILHVVLEKGVREAITQVRSGRRIPVLILSDFLSEPIQSIWQKAILDERARRAEVIRCYQQNSNIDDSVLVSFLQKVSHERLELKLRRFEERLRQLAYERLLAVKELPATYGEPATEGFPDEIPPPMRELTQRDFARRDIWEQILYEGFMEGLGYSKNRVPFLRLSRSVSLDVLRELHLTTDEPRRLALLFAVAGLLPKIKSMSERTSKDYVRALVHSWHDLRSSVRLEKLQLADWQVFPTRPNNFPTLRISAANVLLSRILNNELFRAFIQAMKSGEGSKELRGRLHRLLEVDQDEFWKHHYDFDCTTKAPIAALGHSRIDELIVNTVIPVTLLYARVFKDIQIRQRTLELYDSFPAAQENAITRMMEQQLLHRRFSADTAAKQQGLIHVYKYYCIDGRCSDCDIGRTVLRDD